MKKLLVILLAGLLLIGCNSTSNETEETVESEVEEATETGSEESAEESEAVNNEEGKGGEVNISAAASLQYSLEEITAKYNEENGTEFNLNFGGSGSLREQIEAGAEADIFISANKSHMDTLVEGGFVNEDTLTNLLINDVVLIVPAANEAGVASIEDLTKEEVEVVALGEPESVPVGEYSQQILEHYNIADDVNAKTTFGTDVTQVLNWVDAGEADAGFVYRTDAMQKDNIEVVEAAPAESHDPVVYPAALLKEAPNEEAALAFFEYLQGDEAMAVFEEYGFGKAE